MKKNLVLVAIIGLVISTLCGCGIKVKGADGTEYESYQECCAANDYEAAHKYLAKMKNNTFSRDYESAKEYVFKNEALYLMSIGDENAKKRIIYLLKEEGGNNNHVSMLIDLALENDDEAFVKSLANQYDKRADKEKLMKVMEYLNQKDTDENDKYLYGLFKKLEANDLLLEMAIKNHEMEFIKRYASDSLSLDNKTVLNRLAEIKDNQVSEIIIASLLSKVTFDGTKPKVGKRFGDGNSGYEAYKEAPKIYCRSVSRNNKICLEILSIAIKAKNLYLAKRAAENVKTNYIITSRYVGDAIGAHGMYEYVTQEDNGERGEAQKMLNDAIKAGAFK